MNEKKHFINFILFLGSFLMYLLIIVYIGYGYLCRLKNVYDGTYYAGLKIKYDRLVSVDKPKIIVIGGSSVAFGIDSKLVEKETGIPCVNFGLYAAIGFKPMLDLSKNSINSGDIVILAPELSSQMYSDYIGYEYLCDSIEGRSDMATALGREYTKGLLTSLPKYLKRRSGIRKNGLAIEGVYASSSFDKYGDIIYTRDENDMSDGYNKTDLPDISTDILTDEFFEMVNSYAEYCKGRGASVYFGFPPVNALSADFGSEEIDAFYNKLHDNLKFGILSSLEDHILDAGYFYDSNFHTNDPGTVCNTILFINDIKRVTGDMTAVSVAVPEPLEIDDGGNTGDMLSDGIFNYVLSEKGIIIKGLTEEGKALETLNIPSDLDGYRVYGIDTFAFEDSKAASLTIPECVSSIQAGIIKNAALCKTIYIYCQSLPEVSLDLLYMAPEDVTVYVKKEVYGKYVTDYFWGNFSDRLKPMD